MRTTWPHQKPSRVLEFMHKKVVHLDHEARHTSTNFAECLPSFLHTCILNLQRWQRGKGAHRASQRWSLLARVCHLRLTAAILTSDLRSSLAKISSTTSLFSSRVSRAS
jgi:hypothetical protein